MNGYVAPGDRLISVRVTDGAGNSRSSDTWRVTIERDEFPPETVADGVFAEVDGSYVGGRTLPLTILAEDEDSGVRTVSLTLEGSGPVGSARQAPCQPDCPSAFSTDFTVDTRGVPEGVQTFVVAAADATNNEDQEETLELLVDRTAPAPPYDVNLFDYDPVALQATIDWTESHDPDLSEGVPGSGTGHTEYRLLRNGAWTEWTDTDETDIIVEQTLVGEVITIELRSVDGVGNSSAARSTTLTVLPTAPVIEPVPPGPPPADDPEAESTQFESCDPRLGSTRTKTTDARYREFKEEGTQLRAQLKVFCKAVTHTERLVINAHLSRRTGDGNETVPVSEDQERSVKPKRNDDVKVGPFVAECDQTMVGRGRYIVVGTIKYERGGVRRDITRDFFTDVDNAASLTPILR